MVGRGAVPVSEASVEGEEGGLEMEEGVFTRGIQSTGSFNVVSIRRGEVLFEIFGIRYPGVHVGSVVRVFLCGLSVQLGWTRRSLVLWEDPWRRRMWSARLVAHALLWSQRWQDRLVPICCSLKCLSMALFVVNSF